MVNVGDLEAAFPAGATVDHAALEAAGLVRRDCDGVKILGQGALTKKLVVKAQAFAKSAEEKTARSTMHSRRSGRNCGSRSCHWRRSRARSLR